jgi:23S rRNA-/tRNA-specific pseudouridylate synthase
VHRTPGTPASEETVCEVVDRALRARAKKGAKERRSDQQGGEKLGDSGSGEGGQLSVGAGLGVPAYAPGVVHRLDRGTSGALVLAKTDRAHAALVVSFFRRRPTKTYLCVVVGSPSRDQPHDVAVAGNDERLMEGRATAAPSRDCKQASGVLSLPLDGLPAVSRWKLREEFFLEGGSSPDAERIPNAALLEVETFTGRRHQVRRHVSSGLGCPIALDPLYSGKSAGNRHGGRRSGDVRTLNGGIDVDAALTGLLASIHADVKLRESKKTKRPAATKKGNFIFLHAASLNFPHPCPPSTSDASGDKVELMAPLPNEWNFCLAAMLTGATNSARTRQKEG